jgi:hypothetical protein
MSRLRLFVALVAITAIGVDRAPGALAEPATPMAIVEDVTGAGTGIEFMDYLDEGRTIALKPDSVLVLGYLRSCLRETIKGGTVTVGRERSTVRGGTVTVEKADCEGKLLLTPKQAGTSGVVVFRRPPNNELVRQPAPEATIAMLSPALALPTGHTLTLERLDLPEALLQLPISGHGVDLARQGIRLAPGGLYRAAAGGRSLVFKVDLQATADAGPIVGRLIRL